MSPLEQLRALPYTLFSCHHPFAARVELAEGWVEQCRDCLALRKRLDDRGARSPFWPAEHRRQTVVPAGLEVRALDGTLLGTLPFTGLLRSGEKP